MTEHELLIQATCEGLSKRRKKAKLNLVEAAKLENELLIDVYLKQIKQIDALYDKLEDALETNTNIQLIEEVQEKVQLLN